MQTCEILMIIYSCYYSTNLLSVAVNSCKLPHNMKVMEDNQSVGLGATVKIGCTDGKYLSNNRDSLSVRCDCNGRLGMPDNPPVCEGMRG